MAPDQPHSALVTLKSETEVIITRKFAAPRELVFRAWTTPEHVRRWYGQEHMQMAVCEIDLRIGGRWRYVLEDSEHRATHAFSGEFIDVTPPECLITIERYEGIWSSEHVNVLTLTESDGITEMHVHIKHSSKENRDAHVGAGMDEGLQLTLDRFAVLLAELALEP